MCGKAQRDSPVRHPAIMIDDQTSSGPKYDVYTSSHDKLFLFLLFFLHVHFLSFASVPDW